MNKCIFKYFYFYTEFKYIPYTYKFKITLNSFLEFMPKNPLCSHHFGDVLRYFQHL